MVFKGIISLDEWSLTKIPKNFIHLLNKKKNSLKNQIRSFR
ncbi:MAG: hypothetical protein BAJALOKI2v1_870015 [Promethearchaeota archaeon]|nr:MAG: hypothetical protein BAJALOKI2v1_870015 [Candidatus Lokiarchaeota archaeon]